MATLLCIVGPAYVLWTAEDIIVVNKTSETCQKAYFTAVSVSGYVG
jgi:hypothetical protein